MIKLIAIDLDGTLFDSKKNISIENKKAIAKAKAMGIKVVIATGRPISGAMPVLEALILTSKDDYAFIYNGSKVFNVGTGEIVFSSTINGADVKDLYNESLRLGTHFHAFRKNEELITSKHNPYTDVEATINHIEDILTDINSLNDNDEFLKAMMVDKDEVVTNAINNINPKFTEKYSMVRSAKIFLEFLNKNTHKGHAVEALASYLGIDMSETMAIGDAGNDLPMILCAGIGVAMENSFPEIKEKAKYHTKSNEDDGVAYAIYKYALNE